MGAKTASRELNNRITGLKIFNQARTLEAGDQTAESYRPTSRLYAVKPLSPGNES